MVNNKKLKTIIRSFILVSLVTLFAACGKSDLDSERTGSRAAIDLGSIPVYFVASNEDDMEVKANQPVTRAVSLGEVSSKFEFGLYSLEDGEIKYKGCITQKAGDKSYGAITANLAPGSYVIVALAHNGNGFSNLKDPTKITFSDNKITDTFYYCDTIDITFTSENKEYNLTMKRAVAEFTMITEDKAFPDNFSKWKFEYGAGNVFNALTGYASQDETVMTTDYMALSDNSKYNLYMFPVKGKEAVAFNIIALDESGNEIKKRSYRMIPIIRNRKTSIEGEYFASPQTTRFDADDEWDGMDRFSFGPMRVLSAE
jgi:major membrane immunogen (membrane-anchored lipoprotein)